DLPLRSAHALRPPPLPRPSRALAVPRRGGYAREHGAGVPEPPWGDPPRRRAVRLRGSHVHVRQRAGRGVATERALAARGIVPRGRPARDRPRGAAPEHRRCACRVRSVARARAALGAPLLFAPAPDGSTLNHPGVGELTPGAGRTPGTFRPRSQDRKSV